MIRVALQFLALILTVFTAVPAGAQQSSPGPRLDPALMEREFDSARRERERAQKSDVRLPAVAEPPSRGDTKPLFKLTSVSVNGANVFPRETIAEVYRSYLGKTVSQADLAEIARLISELYREAGFHLSRAIVPPQEIKNGLIQIRVIEGRISEAELKGTNTTRARQLLQPVIAEQPSRLETLERQLLLINDIPGNRIRETTLEEIGSTSGQFRLIVDIETWRVYSAIGLDNRGVPAIGPLQSHFSTALNSYFRPGDAAGLNLSTIPDAPRELTFGQLWYEMPVGVSGSRFAVSAAYGEIWPSDERRLTGTRTRSESFEARFTTVPLRTRKSSLWLTASAGFANVSEAEDQGDLYDDHIRTVALTADYQHQDSLGAWNYLTLTLRQGINIFDASESGDPFLSRADASSTFTKLEFAFTRIHKFAENWSIRVATAGQWTPTPLLASQEFYLGGQAFGRGYSTAEISGDNGIAGSLEVRYDHKLKGEILKGYQLYGFVDGGAVRDFRSGDDSNASLASAGGGIRINFANEFEADIGLAIPLTYRSPANLDRHPRVFFLLSKAFKFCPDQFQMRCS
jgi:hemolysin activation/secretion protein